LCENINMANTIHESRRSLCLRTSSRPLLVCTVCCGRFCTACSLKSSNNKIPMAYPDCSILVMCSRPKFRGQGQGI